MSQLSSSADLGQAQLILAGLLIYLQSASKSAGWDRVASKGMTGLGSTWSLSFGRLAKACSHGSSSPRKRAKVCKASWGLGLDLAQYHLCCILFNKQVTREISVQKAENRFLLLVRVDAKLHCSEVAVWKEVENWSSSQTFCHIRILPSGCLNVLPR